MKDKTLVIMAAGMGSRFGGLKQIEPIGPNGEFIIDYSIYDAIKAGFNRVVFIIKEENFDIFNETVGNRIKEKIKVDYAFQKIENIPEGIEFPKDRVKPWGTSHAILSCKGIVNENFVVLNADDFYGRDAFMVAANFLDNKSGNNTEYAMIGYQAANTLTENGSVKRGVAEEKNGFLEKIIESNVEEKEGIITASPLDGSKSFVINSDSLVSMNIFAFTPAMIDYLDTNFKDFLEESKDNLEKCEYLIPESIYRGIKKNQLTMKVLPTTAKWYGVTYKEDKDSVVDAIKSMIDKGEYPTNLWK